VLLVDLVRIDFLLHSFSSTSQVHRTSWLTQSKAECSIDKLLDIASSLDLSGIPTVLAYDLLLIGHILNPVDVLCPASSVLALDSVWTEASKDQHWSSSARGVVYCGS
jgi:hypothetical protein